MTRRGSTFMGLDSHMITSTVPRPGLPAPSATRGDNGTDPTHGREYTTGGGDLQYACTFALPAPRTCSPADPSCECGGALNPPLCGATPGQQLRAKAYPTLRWLSVARALGDRAVIGSIYPVAPAAGYEETMNATAARIGPKLAK